MRWGPLLVLLGASSVAVAAEPDPCTTSVRAAGATCPPRLVEPALVDWPPDVPPGAEAEILLTVDAEGRVVDTRVLRSDHPALARAAVRVAADLGLDPALVDGVPVASTVRWRVDRSQAAPTEAVEVLARTPWRPRPGAPLLPDAPPATFRLSGGDLERMPGSGGDVVRALQAVPGVEAPRVRSTALSLRGEDPASTLWVVEGVPLPSPRSAGTYLSRIPSIFVESVDVHLAAQPAPLPGSLGGVLDVALIEPDDTEVDGTLELGPGLVQGLVAVPLGRRGSGNALWVGGRRTLLEPVYGVLGEFGLLEDQRLLVEDLALRLRLEPGADHRIDVIGMGGRTLDRAPAPEEGLDQPLEDHTGTVLGLVRHRWTPHPRLSLVHHASVTWEGQRAVLGVDDWREDSRTRPAWRAEADWRVWRDLHLVAGGMGAGFVLRGGGTFPDPRSQPPGERWPWRQMRPVQRDVSLDADLGEGAGWVEARWQGPTVQARAGVRTTAWWDQVLPSPRVALAGTMSTGTHLGVWAGLTHEIPRDPLDYDLEIGLEPPRAARSVQIAGTVAQPLGDRVLVRLDGWQAVSDRRPGGVWAQRPPVPTPTSTGSRRGLAAVLAWRGEALAASVQGTVQQVELEHGYGAFEPTWGAPWSAQGRVAWTLGARQPTTLSLLGRVRAGVQQVGLVVEEDDQGRYVEIALDRERLDPRWQVGARAETRAVLAGLADLTLFADVLVSGGPIGKAVPLDEVPLGFPLPDAELRTIRPWPVVPWVGARARF